MIKEYKTVEDCTHFWINDWWSMLDSSLITELGDWYEHWDFRGIDRSDDESEDDGWGDGLAYLDVPMWNTWFQPDERLDLEFIEAHQKEVAELGFTLIYHDDELWGLGVDGAGYDFYDAHWIPLYKLRGFEWHDTD